MNLKNKIWILQFVWWIYSIIILGNGECPFWIEQFDDGWYLMEEVTGTQYTDKFDGPFDYEFAENYLNDCKNEAKNFKIKYGTVWNLVPEKPRIIMGVVFFIIWLLPLIIGYFIETYRGELFKKNNI